MCICIKFVLGGVYYLGMCIGLNESRIIDRNRSCSASVSDLYISIDQTIWSIKLKGRCIRIYMHACVYIRI